MRDVDDAVLRVRARKRDVVAHVVDRRRHAVVACELRGQSRRDECEPRDPSSGGCVAHSAPKFAHARPHVTSDRRIGITSYTLPTLAATPPGPRRRPRAPVRTLTYIVRRAAGSSPTPFLHKVIGNHCRATSRRGCALRHQRRRCRGHAQRQAPRPADLIVTNARIYTVDDSHPFVAAMAVRDGRVQFVGSEREALALRGPSTQMLDAAGRDRHPRHDRRARPPVRARRLPAQTSISPTRARTTTIVARVAGASKDVPAGRWMIGRGWDQNKWGDTRFPTHEALSRISPNNPVVLDAHRRPRDSRQRRGDAGRRRHRRDAGSGRRTHRARRERRADRRVRRQRDGARSIASFRRSRTTRCVAPRSPRSPSRTVTGSSGCTIPASRAK